MKNIFYIILGLLLMSCGSQKLVQENQVARSTTTKQVVQRSDQNQAYIAAIQQFEKVKFDNEIELYKSFDHDLSILSARIDVLESDNTLLKQEVNRLSDEIDLANKRIDSISGNDSGGTTPPIIYKQKAFQNAFGAGANASGGRGKPIYFVTNLNNSGAGSFRQALNDTKTSNGGIIIFNVSGTIVLTSPIEFGNQDNISILGQTAPIGGITIANHRVRFQNVNNLIVRYLRFRPNYGYATQYDAFEIFQSNNYIIDHCSFSWGTDEGANSGQGKNFTWQNNIIAESKTGMIVGGESSTSENISFLRNVFYNTSHRFPNWQSNGRVDIINNIAWSFRGQISVPNGSFEVNHIGNHYTYFETNNVSNKNKGMMYNHVTGNDFPSIFTEKNYVNDILTNMSSDNWLIWRWRWNPSGTQYSGAGNESALTRDFKVSQPFDLIGETIEYFDALTAFDLVVDNAGSNAVIDANGNAITDIDLVDAVYLDNLRSRKRVPYTQDDVLNTTHRSAFLATVSTTPINVRPSNYDTNNNGVSDSWESANLPNGKTVFDISSNGITYFDIYVDTFPYGNFE